MCIRDSLGKGVECAVTNSKDMELIGVFTRREPSTLKTLTQAPVYSMDCIYEKKDEIDVLILCGGSANDLPKQTAELAKHFNVIDSFDTHANIPEHFAMVNSASMEGKHKMCIRDRFWRKKKKLKERGGE